MGDLTDVPSNGSRPRGAKRHRDGDHRGTLHANALTSFRLGESRSIWVHVPACDPPAERWPVVILLGGTEWEQLSVGTLLDDLIARSIVPPFVSVLVAGSTSSDAVAEANDERFVRFLTAELLPWVGAQWPISETPHRTVVVGAGAHDAIARFAHELAPERLGHVVVLTDVGGLVDGLVPITRTWS